jgi:hypothetical protein
MSKHPAVKTGIVEIRPAEDLAEMIRESERRRATTINLQPEQDGNDHYGIRLAGGSNDGDVQNGHGACLEKMVNAIAKEEKNL